MQDRTITADYAGLKYLKTRSTWRLEFDVDESMGAAVIERLGLPSSGENRQCLIVAINPAEIVPITNRPETLQVLPPS